MANVRGKAIDNTHLSIDQAEERGFIHRDYIAHCLRWTHVCKYLNAQQRYKTADILDIGCGRDVPLARLMYSSRLIPTSGTYTGVDYNALTMPEMFESTGRFPIELFGKFTFPGDIPRLQLTPGDSFEVITCFEVLEHVEPTHTYEMLKAIKGLLANDGVAFLSTPCYDAQVGAAANHVNEMSYVALGAMIESAGLAVDASYGTFASIRDYKNELTARGIEKVFDELREYYDVNYLATIFAPLFPQLSRNACWRVSKADMGYDRKFPDLKSLNNASHSSSDLWVSFTSNYKV